MRLASAPAFAAGLLLLGATRLDAQIAGGIVRDARTGGVVENATVALRNAADSTVAIARSDSLGMFYLAAPAPGRYSLRFNLGTGPERTTPPIELADAEAFHQNTYVVDVPDERHFLEFQVEKPVEALNAIAPAYPHRLAQERTGGRVVAQFVVDTTGTALVETLKGVQFTHREFLDAVRQALPRMRFRPAEISGRRVRQLVQQTFVFEPGTSIPSMQPRAEPWPPPLPRTGPPR